MEDTGLVLYMDIHSQPARTVKTILVMGGVPHTEKNMSLWEGETKNMEFRELYPYGKIPFITDGGFKLGESNAICKYLCSAYPSIPEFVLPKDPKKKALTD